MIEKRDVSALMRSVAEVVREYVSVVKDALTPRLERAEQSIAELLERKPEKGEKGDKGDAGERGLQGEQGHIGPRGPQGELGLTGEAGKDGQNGERGADGKDGIDGRDGLIGPVGPQGESGLTGPSGTMGPRGVDGLNGKDGRDGKDVDMQEVESVLERRMSTWELAFDRRAQDRFDRAIAAMPKPKDGKDGLGFEDMTVDHDGHGNVTFRFRRGELSSSFDLRFPCWEYRGIYTAGETYRTGHGVTFGGSIWVALADDATEKPGTGQQWQLAVKKGRDGRDGIAPPPTGPVSLK